MQRLRAPSVCIIENAADRRRAGPCCRVIRRFKLRAHCIIEVKARLGFRISVVSRKDRNYNTHSLHDEPEVVAQQLRERSHFAVDTHLLELSSPKILE